MCVLFAYKKQAKGADHNADYLLWGYGFMIEQQTDKQKSTGQTDIGDQGADAHIPAGAVDTDIAYFQTNDDDTKHQRGPVELLKLCT